MIIAASRGIGAGGALFLLDTVLLAATWPLLAALALGAAPGWPALLLHPAMLLLFLYALGLYRRDALLDTRRALGRAPLAAVFAGLLAWACAAALPPLGAAADPALAAAAIGGGTAAAGVNRLGLSVLRRSGAFRRRILVIGAGRRAWDMLLLLRREGRTLACDIVCVHDPAMGEVDPRLAADPAVRILPATDGFLPIARALGTDQIVVAPDERRGLPMEGLIACRTAGIPVHEYMRFLETEIRRVDIKRLELGWLLYADGFGTSLLDRAAKRVLDVGVSLIVLLLASPFLLAAALAVTLQDGGPILYRQARLTRGGRRFDILKLRTMRTDAERGGAVWATERDPRVTAIGRFLRRSRLDELPQLWNVLRGDMSFVGPRPERPEFVDDLASQLPLYRERLLVKAGLTGWAQVNYPYGASLDDARSKLSYDLYYVKNFGVLFDLLIILQTLRVVLFPGGGAR